MTAKKPAIRRIAARKDSPPQSPAHKPRDDVAARHPDVLAARDMAWTGQHAAAIRRVTHALQAAPDDAVRVALLGVRAESLVAQGDVDPAHDDARAMLAIAEQTGRASLQAQALLCLAHVQAFSGGVWAALATASSALRHAKRSRDERIVARSLAELAHLQMRTGDSAAAIENATTAAATFEKFGDDVERGRAWWVVACAQDDLGHARATEHAADLALSLARRSGDRRGEAAALNIRWRQNIDLAPRLRGLQRALAAYQDAGNASGQAGIYNNLALAYRALGLYRRSNRMALQAIALRRRLHDYNNAANALTIVAGNDLLTGNVAAARDRMAELDAMRSFPGVDIGGVFSLGKPWLDGMIANAEGDGPAAQRNLQEALRQVAVRKQENFLILILSDLSEAHLLTGDTAAALATTQEAIDRYAKRESRSMGAGLSPAHVWWRRNRALAAAGRAADARKALDAAYGLLLEGIATLSDEGLRRSYLNKIQTHRDIVTAWIADARRRRFSAKRQAAHLAGEADLRAPFERLADTGMRLNELRSVEELQEFLIDEVTELSGAERVLLVLEDTAGPRIAGALLPKDEDPDALLRTATPWLDEARRTRSVSLRQTADAAAALDQRSHIVAPLIAQQRLLGVLYVDIDGAFGRFHDTDRDLIAMLAAQAAVALDNAQFAQGLEAKVIERTAELQASNARTEQRAGELAIISSIQQGIAGSLDFQAIVELVGDKLRDVLGVQDIGIQWFDVANDRLLFLYAYEHGQRLSLAPMPLPPAAKRFIETRKPELYNTAAEQIAAGLGAVAGTDQSLSNVVVPIIGSDRVLGILAMENYQRENAYGEAELRLLQTVAASLGVALENARLFDEAQRLLKETEQRNAELSIINSVQAALAAKLDIQGIYDAIGDKIREIFHQADVGIRIHDDETDLVHFPYFFKGGQRITIPPNPLHHAPITRHVLRTRKTLVINEDMPGAIEALGSSVIGPAPEKSSVFVPLIAGPRAYGLLNLLDMQREHAFSDSDVRLLETLAASMSVALENARLFDETQRLLKETERRSSELAVINSIQLGMAKELSFQAIIDVVGDQLRRMFATGDMSIVWNDYETATVHPLYVYEHGKRLLLPPRTYDAEKPINRALRAGGPVVLGDRAAMDAIGVTTLEGTDSSLSCVFVPVMVGERLVAVIWIESFEREDAFDEAQVDLLSTIAASMGVALENARLLEETQRNARESSALSDVGRDLSATLDLATVMDRIAAHAKDLLNAGNSAIFLPDADGRHYRAIVALGSLAEQLKATTVEPGHGIIGSLIESGRAELINDTAADPRAVQIPGTEKHSDDRLMVVPLLAGESVQGAMAVWRSGGGAFEPRELDFLVGLSRQATIALQNARLFDETQEALARQTASAEVLQVISSSVADTTPVFEAIVRNAARLCDAPFANLLRYDGEQLHLQSMTSYAAAADAGSQR